MHREDDLRRYRRWYAGLLRLYPSPFRERFGESMAQTFNDACRARAAAGRELFGVVLWFWMDTVGGIVTEHLHRMTTRQNSIVRAAAVTFGALLIPLWGEYYVDGWNWGWRGFVAIGSVVFGAALTYQLVVRNMRNKAYRLAMGLAVAGTLLLTWMNFVLAVDASLANFTYFGVVLIGLLGAAVARLRARGMALALLGMALAQLLVPFMAPLFWSTRVAPGAAAPAAGLNGLFIVVFAASALLFERAARSADMAPVR